MTHWLQISSGRGPQECAWVVGRIADLIENEGNANECSIAVLDCVEGDERGTYHSVCFTIDCDEIPSWLRSWIGTILWIGESKYRPQHLRKNWYVSVEVLEQPQSIAWRLQDVRFETVRSSGPGGQHVNKTESAVRATHVPTGTTAMAQERRSQYENKSLAVERLKRKLLHQQSSSAAAAKRKLWTKHSELERGNPERTYRGPQFARER